MNTVNPLGYNCGYMDMITEYNEIVKQAYPTEESWLNDTPVLTDIQEERVRLINSEFMQAENAGVFPDGFFMKHILAYIHF